MRLTPRRHPVPLLLAGALAALMRAPASGAGASGAASPEEPAGLLLTRLDLSVALDVEEGRLTGTARLVVRNTGVRPVRSVSLLIGRLLSASRAQDDAGASLKMEQRVVVFRDEPALQVTRAVVRLGRPLAPGSSTAVRVAYSGIVVGYTEVGWQYVRDRIARDFTILREDAFAFPVLGVPSVAANRAAPREPFAFTLEVKAPGDLLVAAGGELVDRRVEGGSATTTYRSREPVPFLNVAVAPYRVAEREGLRVFHLTGDEAGAREVLDATGKALGLLARWFGPLGREPRLTVIEIPEGFGSQASLSGGILQTADAFRRPEARHQLYHELSHLWNAPDRDAPSPRWNEGLASFLEWRMASEVDGGVDLDARAEETALSLVERCRAEPRCQTVPLVRYGTESMTDWSYRVGSLFFHVLYRVAGPGAFDAVLGGYQKERRASGGTTEELLSSIRSAVPSAGPAVDDWMTTTRWLARLKSGERVRAMVDGYRGTAARIQLNLETSEAEAVLAILSAAGDGGAVPEELWTRLFATAPYVRLKKREAEMKRAFTDQEFRTFVQSRELADRRGELKRALDEWRTADLTAAARRVLAYLPDEALIRATVYVVIKPQTNSFVFEVKSDPAIFLYVDPKVRSAKLENTVAHELHHIGYASVPQLEEKVLAPLAPNVRAAVEWMGAFGEGFAMLAAAGGPGTHPHAASDPADRARWDHDMEAFDKDLETLDRFFLDVIEGRLKTTEEINEKAFSFFGVQGPWYTVGYRMAKVVEEHDGRAELIACMSDPRRLLAAYNRVAAANGGTAARWSPELLRYLAIP